MYHGVINNFQLLTGVHLTTLFQACLDDFEYSFSFGSYLAIRQSDEVFFIYVLYVEPACTNLVHK